MASSEVRPIEFNCENSSICMSPDINYEDVTLIWTDSNVNKTDDCLDTRHHLNTIVNYLKVFDDSQTTIDYIRSASEDNIFLIISGSLGEQVLSQIHDVSQLKFAYIFCMNKENHDQWIQNYNKICGIFINKFLMFHQLAENVRIFERTLSTMSIFGRKHTSGTENSIRDYVTDDNITLMWFELFFDVLLRVPLDRSIAKQDMIAECRTYYKDNSAYQKKIDEFEKDYSIDVAIYWYTRDSFVYRLVNKALRTLNIDIIFKFRFFIIDLYQQLTQRHINYIQSLSTTDKNKKIHTVYRCQHLSVDELEKLRKNIGNIISPYSFFSTTDDFLISTSFIAGSTNSECVVFQIDIPDSYYKQINKSLHYTRPFFKLENLSQFEGESETIFSMGTLFRIKSIEQYDLCYVCLTLEEENDAISEEFFFKQEIENISHTWHNRCNVEDRILLLTEKLPKSCSVIVNVYVREGLFADENYLTTDKGLDNYRKGFELLFKCLPKYHHLLRVMMYLSIGVLYNNMGDRSLAMQFGKTALEVIKTYLFADDDYILVCYNYLAVIHKIEDQFAEALLIYEKMLSIALEHDNTLAVLEIYEEIGRIACDFHDYDYELFCLKNILEIELKLNCQHISQAYFNLGLFYEMRENYGNALKYYKEHMRILLRQDTHITDLVKSYHYIGKMYGNQKCYMMALRVYIRILVIQMETQPGHDYSLLCKYDILIRKVRRMMKCNWPRKLQIYLKSLLLKWPSSVVFIKFLPKLKFLFYFALDDPIELKLSLNMLLEQIITEYDNRQEYEISLENLTKAIKQFFSIVPSCFAKIYRNAEKLRELRSLVAEYERALILIKGACLSTFHDDYGKAKHACLDIQNTSRDIGSIVHDFVYSSHATLCNNRQRQKSHLPHRSSRSSRYRFCGCFKCFVLVRNRSKNRWSL